MRHIIFEEASTYKVAILIKGTSFNKQELLGNYVTPMEFCGVHKSNCIAFTLKYDPNGKASAKGIKEYLNVLLPALDSLGVDHLYVADASYFKTLAKKTKAEPYYGYVLPCAIKGYEHMKVTLGVNYQALIYNPDLQAKITTGLAAVVNSIHGKYVEPGAGIIHSAEYPEDIGAINTALNALHMYPELSCDIEAFSLKFNEAGIGTISFAWNEHNGIAFAVDYSTSDSQFDEIVGLYGGYAINEPVRKLVRDFIENYQGKLTFHNAAYDVKVLIYCLWMDFPLDTEGLLKGLEIITSKMDDTKIIAYLATNSTAGNSLGLKALAHEFAGNWAVDVKDIRTVPIDQLLQYNLVDALCTNYVKNKYYPVMVADNQLDIYQTLMLPSLKTIIQMELTGMPMDDHVIDDVRVDLKSQQAKALDTIVNSPLIKALNLIIQTDAMVAANAKLKTKQHPIEKFADKVFNPNSGPQLQKLLYEQMGLPVIDFTDTKMPATGADTIKKLVNHTENQAYKDILNSLIEYGQVTKILSTFIPAFEDGLMKVDGRRYLHGSFNLGGTVSGRLSSSDPNMQNLPAKSTFGKLIKTCFSAPKGWLFAGADFNSLEDYISALTTKDPNKLAVYERGFDGHCLRAAYYFRDKCPEIDLNDPASVNTIKKKYEDLRQDSKGPTFALTYQGTWITLVNNLGFDEEKAKAIEAGYHELYKVSDQYVQDRLLQASKDGYVDVAFGLRVRTPLLKQVMFGSSNIPYEAAAEGRTAGNALGQSYGLLNNRAANEFMEKVRKSKYRLDIKPVALIHDAIYILIRDDVEIVEWANRELIKSMQWQELPEIQHPTVKLGAALDIYWPNWAYATTLPNDADQETIRKMCAETKAKFD